MVLTNKQENFQSTQCSILLCYLQLVHLARLKYFVLHESSTADLFERMWLTHPSIVWTRVYYGELNYNETRSIYVRTAL